MKPNLVHKLKLTRFKVEDCKKKLSEMNENFEVANAKHEISEIERLRLQRKML